jgi:hypothetical protein
MLMATIVGVWLVQAAPVLPGTAVPFTSSAREWSLGGAFKLKQQTFLRWQPVYDPMRGWYVELRPSWLAEVAPAHPRLSALSFALESAPAPATGGFGMVRPRLQYQVPDTQTRVGVELPITVMTTKAGTAGLRMARPFVFVSGRF